MLFYRALLEDTANLGMEPRPMASLDTEPQGDMVNQAMGHPLDRVSSTKGWQINMLASIMRVKSHQQLL